MEKEPDDINSGQLHNEQIVTLNTQHLTSDVAILQAVKWMSSCPPTPIGKNICPFIMLSRNSPLPLEGR